jgi:hypothetical protein
MNTGRVGSKFAETRSRGRGIFAKTFSAALLLSTIAVGGVLLGGCSTADPERAACLSKWTATANSAGKTGHYYTAPCP